VLHPVMLLMTVSFLVQFNRYFSGYPIGLKHTLSFSSCTYNVVIKTTVVMFVRRDAVHDQLPYKISEL